VRQKGEEHKLTTATQSSALDEKREFLRHVLATLAYRGGKTLRSAPVEFADYGGPETTQTPRKILAHMGDLLDWALSISSGKEEWRDSAPLTWEEEINRFFASTKALDDYLASGRPLEISIERLFQGPIADALTHVGQIAMLRRMAGSPMRGENYFVADVKAGRVGADQAVPRREFD
jgi:hypothetical protein